MKKIREIYVYASESSEGSEGILALDNIALVSSEEALLKMARPLAQRAATTGNRKIRLLKFTSREVLDELAPGGS